MKIQVLGKGCSKCELTEKLIQQTATYWYLSRLLRVKAVPLVAPNGAVLGVTSLTKGSKASKNHFYIMALVVRVFCCLKQERFSRQPTGY